jgi:hypothetical protein
VHGKIKRFRSWEVDDAKKVDADGCGPDVPTERCFGMDLPGDDGFLPLYRRGFFMREPLGWVCRIDRGSDRTESISFTARTHE